MHTLIIQNTYKCKTGTFTYIVFQMHQKKMPLDSVYSYHLVAIKLMENSRIAEVDSYGKNVINKVLNAHIEKLKAF